MDLKGMQKKSKKKEKLLLKQLQKEKINEKFSEWEELNMAKELHPISHYINDREEMIKQMFNVISERQLMKMVPPALKSLSIEELQADCLIQLVGMSKKRIMAILEGRELESSSESPSDSDSDMDGHSMEETPEPIVEAITKSKKSKKASKRSASILAEDVQKHVAVKAKKVKTKHKVKKVEITENLVQSRSDDDINDGKDEIDDTGGGDDELNVGSANMENKGKTLLEILELEMRAKAIRALLERENQPEGGDKFSKEESEKRVDSFESKESSNAEKERHVPKERNSADLETKECSEDIKKDEDDSTIDLTCDNDLSPKLEKTCTKPSEIKNTVENSTVISCERISSTVEKSEPSSEKRSWAERWLDSNNVKKVVTTSKMCTNIRRRIKNSLMMKNKATVDENETVASKQNIVQEFSGSTQEYERLRKIDRTHEGSSDSSLKDNNVDSDRNATSENVGTNCESQEPNSEKCESDCKNVESDNKETVVANQEADSEKQQDE